MLLTVQSQGARVIFPSLCYDRRNLTEVFVLAHSLHPSWQEDLVACRVMGLVAGRGGSMQGDRLLPRSSHIPMVQEAEFGQEREGLCYYLNYKGSVPHDLHLLARPSLPPKASITS